MTEPANPLQEAVNALLTSGHMVEAVGDDFALWLVDGEHAPFSDDELIACVCTLGLIDPPTVPSLSTGIPSSSGLLIFR